ncbi:MAG: hypothetical protein P1U58_20050 [Verrucomicrobiales bacterium]|nr:hypothetical protein [Verrucomicrobiales bacterium]
MKITFQMPPFLLIALISISVPNFVFSQNSVAGMRDSAKHDDLSRKLRMAQRADPIRELGPPVGKTEEDPSLANSERDLIKTSTVFSFRGFLTLVPKRAVLSLPENYKSRLSVTKGAKVQTFRDFYQSNRGWIRTMEVSREQALGHVPFEEATALAIAESSQVVIATYKGGPISVLPLQEEEAVPTAGEMKPVTYQRQ